MESGHLVSMMPIINKEENMKTQKDREAMKAEQERIKETNNQYMISILKREGIDASGVSRFDFDKLLRIQREVSDNERRMTELIYQFNTILNPYRPVVIANSPTTTEHSSVGVTGSTTALPIVESPSTTATSEVVPQPTTDFKVTEP
jgi:hypothetical protein